MRHATWLLPAAAKQKPTIRFLRVTGPAMAGSSGRPSLTSADVIRHPATLTPMRHATSHT